MAVNFVLLYCGFHNFAPREVGFELAVRDGAHGELFEQLLPPPKHQQHDNQVGDNPPVLRLRFAREF
jgi:hypothetical protein